MSNENKIFYVNGDSPGNATSVAALLAAGVDTSIRTKNGKTALDFAKQLHWEQIIPLLEK
jgi:ankyrin repeat protein